MSLKRNSGLDFSDGTVPNQTFEQHPDLDEKARPHEVHLQRNKTERRRLQGLQRTLTTSSATKGRERPMSWKDKFDVWMINEGGRQLFFGVYILLHLLVAVFGFIHYQLKDNAEGARATFGFTFRAYNLLLGSQKSVLMICSHCPNGCFGPPCRRYLHPPARLPQLHFTAAACAAERCHPIRQEHNLPQGHRLVHRRRFGSTYPRTYGQFCQACYRYGEVPWEALCRLPVSQFPHRTRSDRMDYDCCPRHHGLVCPALPAQSQL